jgi:hypothetical protein
VREYTIRIYYRDGGLGGCCGRGDAEAWRSGDLEGRCRHGDMVTWRHGGLEVLEGVATRVRWWSRTATARSRVARPPRRYPKREAAVRSGGGSKVWRQRQAGVCLQQARGRRGSNFDEGLDGGGGFENFDGVRTATAARPRARDCRRGGIRMTSTGNGPQRAIVAVVKS